MVDQLTSTPPPLTHSWIKVISLASRLYGSQAPWCLTRRTWSPQTLHSRATRLVQILKKSSGQEREGCGEDEKEREEERREKRQERTENDPTITS